MAASTFKLAEHDQQALIEHFRREAAEAESWSHWYADRGNRRWAARLASAAADYDLLAARLAASEPVPLSRKRASSRTASLAVASRVQSAVRRAAGIVVAACVALVATTGCSLRFADLTSPADRLPVPPATASLPEPPPPAPIPPAVSVPVIKR